MSDAWSAGSSRYWREVIRPAVFARARGRCEIALPGEWKTREGERRRCLVVADCVHHVLGKKTTGDDLRYLQAACTPCNLKIGDPTKRPDPAPRPMTRW